LFKTMSAAAGAAKPSQAMMLSAAIIVRLIN